MRAKFCVVIQVKAKLEKTNEKFRNFLAKVSCMLTIAPWNSLQNADVIVASR